jgi:dihydrofolate reductase
MEGGETGLDNDVAMTWSTNIGATIMGRNMFGPVRASWDDEAWTGWWGDDPPFHTPVFVLTHHAREPVEMQGGTTFHFVTGGIEAALERAMATAGGQDVAIAGGAETGQQYLRAGLIDEMVVHVVPGPPRRRFPPLRESRRRAVRVPLHRACQLGRRGPLHVRQARG